MQAKQNLCLLGVCAKLDVQAYCLSKHSCFHIRFVCHSLKSAMVMLQASQLCFAVFLASLLSIQAEGNSFPLFISRRNNNSLASDSGFINNSRCGWDCTIINSDFPKHWKTVSVNDRLIKVVVEYEKKVTEQCARQASLNSSGNGTEYFNVWLPANYKHFNFDHAVQRVLDLVTSSNTEERVDVKTACAFRSLRTSSAEPVNSILNRYVLSQPVRSHLADHGFNVKRSNDCNAEMSNLQSCIIMSNSTVNSTVDDLIRETVWFDCGLVLVLVFLAALAYYSPACICFFFPTVITEHGLRQIVLEGASPVGFRSLMGNYFHSGCGHGARILFLRLVLFPLPFLCPAIVFDKLLHKDKKLPFLVFSQPFMTVFLVCYILQAILSSFFKGSRKAKPCCFCRFFKPNYACDTESCRRVLNHMRIQPLILVKCWWYFRRCLVQYFNMCRVILPARRNMSPRWFFRVAGFLVLLSAIPVVTITLFAAMLVVDVFSILFTSPLKVLLHDDKSSFDDITLLNRWPVLVFVQIPVRALATTGAVLVLACATLGFGLIMTVVFILLLSEQSLPFVVLSVLVCYYLWSSYSSFTNRYHELSLILFKCYQGHLPDQVSKEVATATTADPAQDAECIPNAENEANVIKIPKELFDIACEELMPIRESVCVLVVKVVFILSFVFVVFAVIMTFHIGATPLIRALVTFLTGSLPKIFAIYIDGARKRNLETMVIEERALRIVQRYLNRTANSDPGQDSSGTVQTEEVIIVDENEESIQLANMETS